MAEDISMRTAECVTPKHPDKMCDQISDAVLDFCLKQDENARVAIEALGGHGKVVVMGELTFKGAISDEDIKQIVYRIVGHEVEVSTNIVKQSPEIANGVDTGGAGDQGIMKGFACDDNEEMIPQEMYLARSLCKFLYSKFPYDGKTQITLKNGRMDTIVASFQNVSADDLDEAITEWVTVSPCNANLALDGIAIHTNPAGDWSQGGFDADTGLTGRKLMVDNYGPQRAIGGGAFSGKDATKVDRSAAYMARKIAVDLLRKHNAKVVSVDLAYAIGIAEPVMATATLVDQKYDITMVDVTKEYDLTPKGIIDFLSLREPIFEETARFGHFGNGFAWDK